MSRAGGVRSGPAHGALGTSKPASSARARFKTHGTRRPKNSAMSAPTALAFRQVAEVFSQSSS